MFRSWYIRGKRVHKKAVIKFIHEHGGCVFTIAASEMHKAARCVCSDGKILWLENGAGLRIKNI